MNHGLADQVIEKISKCVQSVQNKDVGILGLAFKPNTNSVAGSSSMRLAKNLIAQGARVRAYDPVALPDARLELNGTVYYCESPYAAAEGVDALVVGTGWPEFRGLDFTRIKQMLRRPLIVDTKNLLDSVRLRAMGFEYVGVGRRSRSDARDTARADSRTRLLSEQSVSSIRRCRRPSPTPFAAPVVIIARRGGSSSTGRAPDCGSGRCGFDSRLPPQHSKHLTRKSGQLLTEGPFRHL